MARSKKACILFFDEIDAIGGARFDDGVGSDNEVQRTMLEILYQLDGFDARGNIKVLMATNRLVHNPVTRVKQTTQKHIKALDLTHSMFLFFTLFTPGLTY
jgi:26S proteasome regulatory subunit T1